MGWLDRIFARALPSGEARSSTIDLSQYWRSSWPGAGAGVLVNDQTALQVTTVLACVRLIACDVATLPLKLFEAQKDGRDKPLGRDDTVAKLLLRAPNEWQTAHEFKAQLTAHALLMGDGVAEVVRNSREGAAIALYPIAPHAWRFDRAAGEAVYRVTDQRGERTLKGRDVVHIRGLTWDGERGLSVVNKAREAIGLASALEGAQSRHMSNGARPSGVLTTAERLDKETVERVRDAWRDATTGENQFRTPLLDGGFKFDPVTMKSTDAQLIETRKHQVTEICAAFGVSPAVLGLDDKTQAFASVEAMMRWHLAHTLRPWLAAWEQAIDRSLLDGAGPKFARFDTREMEKASTRERAESYRTLVELGIMTRNEARELEGLPPIDGGDVPLVPMNMTTQGADDET